MKDSGIPWVGEIPKNWRVLRGKNILMLLERPVKEDDGVITCFRDGEVTLRSKRREEGYTFSLQEIGYQGIEPGDLVVHGMDGFAGSIGISDSRGKGTPVLNVMDSSESKKYLMYQLRTMAHCGLFFALSSGIRIRSCDTNWNKLKAISYLIPPKNEQLLIVSFIDAKCAEIDSILESTTASIEEYKKLKQSVINEAVTKGIRGERPLKKSDLEWCLWTPTEWALIRINHCLLDKSDYSSTGEETQLSVTQDRGIIFSSEANIANPSQSTIGWKRVSVNDLVFNKYKAHSGVFFVSPYNGIVTFNYNVYVCLDTCIPQYLEYLFKSPGCISEFKKKMKGVGESISPLYTRDLFSILVPLPPLSEQWEIVNYLDEKCAAIDALIASKEALIKELEAYKKSLIYEYVTGKKEVPAQ